LHADAHAAAGVGKSFVDVQVVLCTLHGLPWPQAQIAQVCGSAEAVLVKTAPSAVVATPAPKIFSA
jgi:hypothetical protein